MLEPSGKVTLVVCINRDIQRLECQIQEWTNYLNLVYKDLNGSIVSLSIVANNILSTSDY